MLPMLMSLGSEGFEFYIDPSFADEDAGGQTIPERPQMPNPSSQLVPISTESVNQTTLSLEFGGSSQTAPLQNISPPMSIRIPKPHRKVDSAFVIEEKQYDCCGPPFFLRLKDWSGRSESAASGQSDYHFKKSPINHKTQRPSSTQSLLTAMLKQQDEMEALARQRRIMKTMQRNPEPHLAWKDITTTLPKLARKRPINSNALESALRSSAQNWW